MVLTPLSGPFLLVVGDELGVSSLIMLSLGRKIFRTHAEFDRVLPVRISNVDFSIDIA